MKRGLCAQLIAAVATFIGASGCLSMGTVQTADTLGKGHFQVAIEPGIYGASVGTAAGVLPHFDVAFRYGLTERFDLGVRTGSSMLELQTKFLFTDPQSDLLAMSLAPTIGGVYLPLPATGTTPASTTTFFNIGIPLLVGLKHFNGNEVTFGPRINNTFLVASGTGGGLIYLFGVGGSVGYAFAFGETFKLLPEFAVNFPVAATAATSAGSAGSAGFAGLIYQFKLGIIFGRSSHKPSPAEVERPARRQREEDVPPPPPQPAPAPAPESGDAVPLPPPPPPPQT